MRGISKNAIVTCRSKVRLLWMALDGDTSRVLSDPFLIGTEKAIG